MANTLVYGDLTFRIGDTVTVSLKVVEGEKTRRQDFTGVLIAVKGREANKSFTIRKIGNAGVGVERILPVGSPDVMGIKKKSSGVARRSKLYYLRRRTGKKALRVKSIEGTVEGKQQKEKDEPAKKKTGSRRRSSSKKVSDK